MNASDLASESTRPVVNTPEPKYARWFAEHVLPEASNLRGYLRGTFPSLHDVDDVIQESYLRIWRARTGRQIRSARAFLFRVARNLAFDNLRRSVASPVESRETLDGLTAFDETPDASEALTREEKVRLLGEALADLPDRCREIVFLHKIDGLSQRAVAERFHLSEKTVANQIGLGVRRCERYLRRRGVEGF